MRYGSVCSGVEAATVAWHSLGWNLQGFPDNYTQIPYRNKDAADCPDGPRYKAMGNSMAVPVMRWIGQRINMVHNLQVPDITETT